MKRALTRRPFLPLTTIVFSLLRLSDPQWLLSITATLPPPLLAQTRRTTLLPAFPKLPVSSFREPRNRVAVVVRASGESSESSSTVNVIESVQSAWNNSEDRIAVVGLGFAAVAGVWASANLITAIDKLPLLPSVLEFVGILYSSWFVYRYLLFKPDREELFQIANKSISKVLGQ